MSELVRASKSDDSWTALQMGNLFVSKDRVWFHLLSSKTDQFGRGQVISLGLCSVTKLCLVKALSEFVQLRGDVGGDLVCHKDSLPLTQYQFWTVTS